MNYEQTVAYLYEQLPMFSRVGQTAYKADLHNTLALCDYIGNPHKKIRTIHIAGTNGKGSTSHMIAAILQAAGYKTGLYTSPHIKDFRERIRINGQMITQQQVVDFVAKTMDISNDIQPSFFELTVALAFDYFAQEAVDIAVIETGMGGLLDSTNIITPLLSIITNIGYDHQNILGGTLPEIATQKAGIIKPNIPVVIGKALEVTLPIFLQTAAEKNAPISFATEHFETVEAVNGNSYLETTVLQKNNQQQKKYSLGLTGLYQTENICTLLQAVEILKSIDFNIEEQHIQQGVRDVKLMTGLSGRWDVLSKQPLIIADVAHNKDGITQVLQQLATQYPTAIIHFVLGFVKDKDVAGVLALFPKNGQYYFTNAHIPRALPATDLQTFANQVGLHGDVYDNVNDAVTAAAQQLAKADVIMVCGSFFVIAELDIL